MNGLEIMLILPYANLAAFILSKRVMPTMLMKRNKPHRRMYIVRYCLMVRDHSLRTIIALIVNCEFITLSVVIEGIATLRM